MGILAFRHVPHEHLGSIAASLDAAGLDWRYVDWFADPGQLDLGEAHGLVVMGGPMGVYEMDRYPFLAREVALIREAVRGGLPVLGVCLGSQLLAHALGARVYPNPVKEIGWYPVEVTADGEGDGLLKHLAPRRVVFQWHGDTFDLPEGAVHLAHAPACHHQAFRWGDRAYGLQFHLEVDRGMIEEWLAEPGGCAEVTAACGPGAPAAIRRGSPGHLHDLGPIARRVFGEFCSLIKGSAFSVPGREG